MLNHLKKFLKVDLRYKWLLINLVFGTFFMIAPYIYMVSPDQQVLTLKGMLCWFGLNQAFFWYWWIHGRRKNGWHFYKPVSIPRAIQTIFHCQSITDRH